MEAKSTELVRLEGEREKVLQGQSARLIASEVELTEAVEFLSKLRIFTRRAEEVRTFLVKPLNDHVKNINTAFKKLLAPVVNTEEVVSHGIQTYRQFPVSYTHLTLPTILLV